MKAAVDHLVAKYAGFTFDDFARDMVLCAAAVAEKETAALDRSIGEARAALAQLAAERERLNARLAALRERVVPPQQP